MEFIKNFILPCIYAYFACFSFGLLFNIRGHKLFLAALGGMISWIVYSVTTDLFINDIPQYVMAAAAVAVYAELMAVITKAPVTVYLVLGIIPLVPGGNIYYAMEALIGGSQQGFMDNITATFGIAGAIALGVFLSSSVIRIIRFIKNRGKTAIAK